ncbi:MAG: extracellular solute-binding protein [Paracholeplasma sp.]|nr:extracellular solute-binding protein [Paracholeplasma sp.]MDY3195459.1 extracellular solute-binding protein [Paracholeplasma sp.]
MIKKVKKTKFYIAVQRQLKKVKNFFVLFGLKKTILSIIVISLSLVVVFSFFKTSENNDFFDARKLANTYESSAINQEEDNYTAKLLDYRQYGHQKTNIVRSFDPFDMVSNQKIDHSNEEYQNQIDTYYQSNPDISSKELILFNKKGDRLELDLEITTAGIYYLSIDYIDVSEAVQSNQIALKINDDFPFYESRTLILDSSWVFDSTEFKLDRYQNEIQPSSSKVFEWNQATLKDLKGMHDGLFGFYLEAGDKLSLEHVSGSYLIGKIHFVQDEVIVDYDTYLATHKDAVLQEERIEISAKDIKERSDASIRLRAERDPSSMHYHTQFLKMNTIFGDSWQNGGQSITYQVDVAKSGFYHVGFKYRQYMIKDMPVFRKIYVNGEVPFDLLSSYAFPYTTSFMNRTLTDEEEKPLLIYLNEGTNELTLEAVLYPYRTTIETIKYVMSQIQDLSLRVKKYTSGGTDRYRDWDIETYFPTAKEDVLSWATILDEAYKDLKTLSNTDEPSEISNLKVAAKRLRDIAKNINKLPSRMVQFSDGDSSVNQFLGDLMQRLMRSNLEIERSVFYGKTEMKKPYANIFVSTFEGFKRLVLSFVNNPYSTSRRSSDELIVWVNHPRQYIEIMQMMIDSQYDGDMKVTLSQMPDQNKLILANVSGDAPDLAIGVDHWIPYEFAIRDASLDLRQFKGYEAMVSEFSKGAMIPYVFEDGVYGVPETQNFWVTYYRTDILSSIGITDVPQTWDEIIEILPLLQSYGMNYFVPLAQYEGLKPFVATLPFIYQFGGDLYQPDGMSTAINSDQTLQGIKLMSELFTLYNLPQRVANFYNHFRYGLLPIGVSDLSTYILLSTAASELDGLWQMDLHPGVYNEEKDEIVRYSAVGAQGSMILSSTKHKDESFDFLKWWMSTDVQSDFGFLLQTTYGKQYFWNSANIEAFKTSSMPEEFKDVVLEQWNYGIEASRIPGAYMVEREISNAWSSIVYNNVNPRLALDDAMRISNREILYKMSEFGYVENNVVIKDYTVPSIYNIDRWLTEVDHD